MRDLLGDDRFLFFGASSVIILFLSFFDLVLSGFIFWTLAVVWAAIFVLALKVKKYVLKADTWAEAEKLGTISRKTTIGLSILFILVLFSALIPTLVARIFGSYSIAFSGIIGQAFGVDFSIASAWIKRQRQH
jgi:hypothetical protein